MRVFGYLQAHGAERLMDRINVPLGETFVVPFKGTIVDISVNGNHVISPSVASMDFEEDDVITVDIDHVGSTKPKEWRVFSIRVPFYVRMRRFLKKLIGRKPTETSDV